MAFEINKALDWIAKALGRSKKPGVSDLLPSFLEDGIRGTVDVLGWERYLERKSTSVQGVLTAQYANGPVTPEGQARLIIAASVTHNAVAGKILDIQLVETRGSTVGLGTPITISGISVNSLSGVNIPLLNPVLLLPGDFIRGGRANAAFGAGEQATLFLAWLELALGEYVPPT